MTLHDLGTPEKPLKSFTKKEQFFATQFKGRREAFAVSTSSV